MSSARSVSHNAPQSAKPLGKSPAFQFYPKDFLTDANVMIMSCEARGAYITLLCIDWLEDGFRADWLCKLSGYEWTDPNGNVRDAAQWKTVEAQLRNCFISHPSKEGFLTNPRLQKERCAQIERRQERSEAGRRGGKARQTKALHNEAELKLSLNKPQAKSSSSSPSSSSSSSASRESISRTNTLSHTPPLVRFGSLLNMTAEQMAKLDLEFGSVTVQREIPEACEWVQHADTPSARKYRKPNYNHYLFFKGWLRRNLARPSPVQKHKTAFEKNLELIRLTEIEEGENR